MASDLQRCQGQQTQREGSSLSRSKQTGAQAALGKGLALDPGPGKNAFLCSKSHKWGNGGNLSKVCRLDRHWVAEETYLLFRNSTGRYLEAVLSSTFLQVFLLENGVRSVVYASRESAQSYAEGPQTQSLGQGWTIII